MFVKTKTIDLLLLIDVTMSSALRVLHDWLLRYFCLTSIEENHDFNLGHIGSVKYATNFIAVCCAVTNWILDGAVRI